MSKHRMTIFQLLVMAFMSITATFYPTPTMAQTMTDPVRKLTPEAPIAEKEHTVFITKTGSKYHADDCRYLSRSKIPIELKSTSGFYQPFSVCNPPAQLVKKQAPVKPKELTVYKGVSFVLRTGLEPVTYGLEIHCH